MRLRSCKSALCLRSPAKIKTLRVCQVGRHAAHNIVASNSVLLLILLWILMTTRRIDGRKRDRSSARADVPSTGIATGSYLITR